IESGCVEGWYGDECLDECPLQGTEECGGSGYGTCDSSTHTCDCNLGYEGEACEFLNYDSLEAFICGELASESGLVTLHEGTSLTCTAEGDISVSELCNIATLDLSTSGLTSIAGLSS
ncbi:hypothetical protein ADUPG1_004383, partial [Aduncisulcus paluster]